MAFTKTIKKSVLEKAAFRCCRCQSIGVEVHHIIPQEHKGSDDITNAAPLCPNCHTDFGDNTKKRKNITHMRDWWYRTAKNKYPSDRIDKNQLSEINSNLKKIQKNQDSSLSELNALKSELKDVVSKRIDSITPEMASITASGLINSTSASGSPGLIANSIQKIGGIGTLSNELMNSPELIKFGNIDTGMLVDNIINTAKCPRCGSGIKMSVGLQQCPFCGDMIMPSTVLKSISDK